MAKKKHKHKDAEKEVSSTSFFIFLPEKKTNSVAVFQEEIQERETQRCWNDAWYKQREREEEMGLRLRRRLWTDLRRGEEGGEEFLVVF